MRPINCHAAVVFYREEIILYTLIDRKPRSSRSYDYDYFYGNIVCLTSHRKPMKSPNTPFFIFAMATDRMICRAVWLSTPNNRVKEGWGWGGGGGGGKATKERID